MVKIKLTRPGLCDRIWYQQLGMPLPHVTGTTAPLSGKWVRLLPYRWRRLHRFYAEEFGFFWIPCPLCARPYGGHEMGTSVPDPTRSEGCELSICSQCTISRKER